MAVGVVTPHAAAGPEAELPGMTRDLVAPVVSRTGVVTCGVAGRFADGTTRRIPSFASTEPAASTTWPRRQAPDGDPADIDVLGA
jgi:hypothetical protein